ncbi:hypothetical protein BDY19DRAFT_912188 [Irpex rosettiformis]|uniref:Uncharacterized protein n=1 Tax=Irpex rosettiformis TaxID=378272 RepID=A0ACB8UIY5_9APHY|nr:hypothetical protein BDY19DRAFT_912188 [Irpex rosettiformis]
MTTTTRTVYLPAGTRPGWELDDEEMNTEDEEWNNLADSLVILQSLKQSREKWLTSAFPKFSGRARGSKQPEVKAPPHSVRSHNKFELSVGPHIFSNTRLYEIHYPPEQPIPIPSSTSASSSFAPEIASSSSLSDVNPAPQTRFKDFITPTLLEHVTQAATTDPILHNLLTLAQKNQLSEEQRLTLAAFVRSLNEQLGPNYSRTESSAGPSTSVAPAPPPRPFDLVIEFQERSSDRWLVPRGAVYLEDTYASTAGSQYDVIVTTNLPLGRPAPVPQEGSSVNGSEQPATLTQTVKLHWRGLHQDSYDVLIAWSRGDTMSDDSEKLNGALNNTKRTYLAHQLPNGELLEILRAACNPYLMKPIKPTNADSTRTRRKSSTRRAATEKSAAAAASNAGGITSTLPFSNSAQPTVSVRTHPVPVVHVTVPTPAPPTAAPSYAHSVFPVLPPQPIVWNPPAVHSTRPTEYYPPGPSQYHGPPQYAAPLAVQYTPPRQQQYSPPPPVTSPIYSSPISPPIPAPPTQIHVGSSSSQRLSDSSLNGPQNADYNNNGVSFAPISTPAIEARSVESSIQRAAARPKPKRTTTNGIPPPIRCRACKETDIPLLMGGRICRKCLDGGRLGEAIPELANGSVQSSSSSSTLGN